MDCPVLPEYRENRNRSEERERKLRRELERWDKMKRGREEKWREWLY